MKSVLIGTCDYCGGEVYENSLGNILELWCESEQLMVDASDVVIPVPDAPEELHDNDPEAYGEFQLFQDDCYCCDLNLELIGA